jgi:NitT/TauT family transport system ATP-binding protein
VLTKEKEELALKLAEELGLKSSLKLKPSELSGGMKRRVAIIKAIAYGGDALILDEAFNGLDNQNKIKIADIIKREFILKGKPVLMITHIEEDAALLDAKTLNFA